MGRQDLRPLQVYRTATHLLKTSRLKARPPWLDVVYRIPPAEALVRPQPVQHHAPRKVRASKKASKMFQPQVIIYPEDEIRRQFFADHPWELARPRVVLENDGKDAQALDWSRLRQRGRPVDGESVVQRQRWLMQHVPALSRAEAYDQARKEFYAVRYEEDVQRRVAKEEALSTGAYFGMSYLDVGMQLEDQQWEQWKASALGESAVQEQKRLANYTGLADDEAEVGAADDDLLAEEEVAANVI